MEVTGQEERKGERGILTDMRERERERDRARERAQERKRGRENTMKGRCNGGMNERQSGPR